MNKEKVFVKAYTALNLGDDLFLKILFKRYPKVSFMLEAPLIYQDVFADYGNVLIIDLPQYKTTLFYRGVRFLLRHFCSLLYVKFLKKKIQTHYSSIISKCSCFIMIGGSIFMECGKLDKDILFYEYLISEKPDLPKFFLGCNFGPYKTNRYYEKYKKIYENFTDITFRDLYSYKLFSNIESVRYCPDLVLNLPVFQYVKKTKNDVVGFTLRYRGGVNKMKFINRHLALIKYYLDNGFRIRLFSFCEREGDSIFLDEIYNLLVRESKEKLENVEKVYYTGNITSFLEMYSSVKFMFCERFHSIILSLLFKQHIVPIVYSDKMTDVLGDLEYKGNYFTLKEFVDVDLATLIKSLEYYFVLPEGYIQQATGHFYKLDNSEVFSVSKKIG